MSAPYAADPSRPGSALSRSFLPLALITLGVVFLLGNLVPDRARAGLVVLGLGAAFLLGRLTTGRYGYAVPAGILIGIGAFLTLHDAQPSRALEGGGWFFVLLGLGFVLVYLIGLRPWAIWPLFPGTVLIGLGVVLFGVGALGALAALSWIVAYWPAALVVIGIWLLVRDQLPLPVRRPIATLGGLALLAYGLLAAASSVAAGGALARTGLATSLGPTPFADSITLETPIASGQTFSVDNPNGHTSIRAGNASVVHVVATRRALTPGQAPEVQLQPDSNGVSLGPVRSSGPFPFGQSSSVDFTIEVPATVQVVARSGSGQLDIDGIAASVQSETSSGGLKLANLSGGVQARSSSGSIELTNIAGDLQASTNSGQIRGTELLHVREITSTSGSVSLEGTFTDPAQIRASSGSVQVRLLPGSAVQLDVKTSSGSVNPHNIVLSGGATSRTALSGSLGAPAPGSTLSIQTSSGSISISQ